MTRFLCALLFSLLVPLTVHAATPNVDEIDKSVTETMNDGPYTFCKTPRKPLSYKARSLCTLSDVQGCEGFDSACKNDLLDDDDAKKHDSSKMDLSWLGDLARVLLFVLVAAIVVAIAIPIIAAFRRARRNKKLADKPSEATKVVAVPVVPPPVELEAVGDAEEALRLAEEHRRRGEYARALALYLAAALTALDRRGAIRIAKHRTNGEYVRFCTDDTAKPPLREIVREVDKVQYGKLDPSEDAVARVASRAASVVRQAATIPLLALALVLFATGCGGGRGHAYDDPEGDELPIAVLKKHGFDIAPLGRSIVSMPVTDKDEPEKTKDDTDVVVIDTDRVPLDEEETEAHLLRWVEGGGVLVLFGHPSSWPKELGAKSAGATSRDLSFQDYRDDWKRGVTIQGRVAQPRSVKWSDASTLAWLGTEDPYVVRKLVGRGVVFGVANDDLFTNVGILPKHNGAILVSIMRLAGRDARMIHPERAAESENDSFSHSSSGSQSQSQSQSSSRDDTAHDTSEHGGKKNNVKVRHAQKQDGIPPPTTPFAALLAAGLGKGTWHALAATLILFLAFGIRHARPKSKQPQTRRAFTEHVEATGAFWGRAKALPHALAAYGKFVELRLRERVPRGHDPVAFLAARAKVDPDHASRLYKRAVDAKDDDPVRGDELETIRELRLVLTKALEAS